MSDLQKELFDIATGNLCAWVAEKEGLAIKDAMRIVYSSKLYEKLQDPETGLYREGPVYLYDMLAEERGFMSKTTRSTQAVKRGLKKR